MTRSQILANLPKYVLNKYETKKAQKVRDSRSKEWEKKRRHAKGRRLYALACMTGYRRGQRQQHVQTSILKIQGCQTKESSAYYVGKKCAFVYRAKNEDKHGSNVRAIWGKVTRSHGNSGSVRAKFRVNLPPQAIGKRVRIMMYPSRV